MAEVLIKVRDLGKRFMLGKTVVDALADINLDVYQGEYLSIMGPSGSGKTTLFNMIGALDKPTRGEVTIAGVRLADLNSRQLAHFRGNHIGYIFQTFNLMPAYSAVDNVALPLIFSGIDYHSAVERSREVLARVGLGHRFTHLPDELSGGQQQRVAIARALANKPAIILADEPTGNLDLQTGEDIIALLRKLSREDGVTVITATHDHKMLDVSDRILWVRDGGVERLERRENVDIQLGKVT